MRVSKSCSVMSDSLQTIAHQASLSVDSPGKNTGMGSHFLLQEIFPTQGLNLGLLHFMQILYHLSHKICASHLTSSGCLVILSISWFVETSPSCPPSSLHGVLPLSVCVQIPPSIWTSVILDWDPTLMTSF